MTSTGKMLLAGSAFLSVVLIALSVMEILPFRMGDFVFLFGLSVLAALYRPGWVFLGLMSVLPLELVNLAPSILGVELRPYQFLEVALFAGLLIRFFAGRGVPEIPKIGWVDIALLLIPIGSLLSLGNAASAAASFKLSLVLFSFYGLYVLARVYIQSFDDAKKVIPFVFASGAVTLVFAIIQNTRFLSGLDPFEVMPGRPNAMFPEPDWFGMYLILFGSVIVPMAATFFSVTLADPIRGMWRQVGLLSLAPVFFAVLLMTVARSAWLGMTASFVTFISILLLLRWRAKLLGTLALWVSGSFFVAFLLVSLIPLSRFDLLGRAVSTAGIQEVTISCENVPVLPEVIGDVAELPVFGCRHIDLEEIVSEQAAGRFVSTIDRPDPNVEIRKDIYGVAIGKIVEHPFFGIGWGSIGAFLGTDDRGVSLNASNAFLEVWLGSGLLGFLGFLALWVAIPLLGFRKLFRSESYDMLDAFILSAWAGLTVFNLFNSGILLGFFWVFLGVAVLMDRKLRK